MLYSLLLYCVIVFGAIALVAGKPGSSRSKMHGWFKVCRLCKIMFHSVFVLVE